jgi:hypothetical protein
MKIWKLKIEGELFFVRAESEADAAAQYPYAENAKVVEATRGEAKAFSDAEEQTFAYVILEKLKRMTGELLEDVSKK